MSIELNQILMLKDMGGDPYKDSLTDIVIFDNPVDMKALKEEATKLSEQDEWTYDDLLDMLEKFGGYSVVPLDSVNFIEY